VNIYSLCLPDSHGFSVLHVIYCMNI
jgi:hypothetical protein